MKRAISLFVILLTFSLLGYGGISAQAAPAAAANEPTSLTAAPAPTPNDQAQTAAHGNVLVLYFSATGTTKRVAEKIAAVTGGDLLEIVPAQPYTTEDLNYNDSSTRATVEQNTPDARPEIANDIDLEGYDTLYLGYPIWWGQAPRIMSTFAETHDFDGITVIPFCTSGGSDIGLSDDTLAEQAGNGIWLQGRRFSGSFTEDELQMWINETGGANREKELRLTIDDNEITVDWEENEPVRALLQLCAEQPLVIEMSMYGGFEQVGPIGTSLPRDDMETTTSAGDIVLYSGNQIVVFYGSNSWTYTRLGKIQGLAQSELAELLGNRDVELTLYAE